MVQTKQEELLSHPLLEIYLLQNWQHFGGYFFYMTFVFYIIYVFIYTEFAVTERTDDEDEKSFLDCGDGKSCFKIFFTFIVSLLYLLKEIAQLINVGFDYFKHLTNYVEFLAYFTTLASTFPHLDKIHDFFPIIVDACALFLLYFNIILFMRYVGFFGISIMMFLEMLKTMIKVVAIFVLFQIPFGLTLFILCNKI